MDETKAQREEKKKMELTKMSDGIYLIGIYGSFKVGLWLLESNGECALFEMPEADKNGESPAKIARRIIDQKGWKCKYLFLSHPHIDHSATIREFRETFPEAIFPAHYSLPMYMRVSEHYWTKSKREDKPVEFEEAWKNIKGNDPLWYLSFYNSITVDDITCYELGCEKIYMIYGPKHSLGDVHYIYRGCWFSGDWWIYEGDPSEDRIASSKAIMSLNRLEDFSILKNYKIHTVFPSHANNILRNVDFHDIITRTRKYQEELEEKRKDGYDWTKFGLKELYYWVFTVMEKQKK